MIKVSRVFTGLAAAGIWLAACAANATPVTLVGDTINYVYDDSQAALGLLGAPMISGDAIMFAPGTFRAKSLNGASVDSVVMAEFVFSSVSSQDGRDLGLFEIVQFGDYEIGVDGAIEALLELTVADNRSSQSSTVTESLVDTGASPQLQLWNLTAARDVAAVFSAATDDIALTIKSTLSASTGANGEIAWIQNKLSFGFAGLADDSTNPPAETVPAPGVLWLVGSGLVLIAIRRPRTRKKARK